RRRGSDKRSSWRRRRRDGRMKVSRASVLVPRGSRSQDDLDVDSVRHLDAHELAQGPLVRIEVDEPLVDPHLPAVPGLAPFAVGGLADGHDETLRRERDRTRHRDAGALAVKLDLLAHVVDLLRVRAAERDPRLLGHASTWGIGSRGRGSLRLLYVVDLARRDGLAHVADREAAQLGEGLIRLDDEGLRRPDFYPGRVAGLEEVGLLGLRR